MTSRQEINAPKRDEKGPDQNRSGDVVHNARQAVGMNFISPLALAFFFVHKRSFVVEQPSRLTLSKDGGTQQIHDGHVYSTVRR